MVIRAKEVIEQQQQETKLLIYNESTNCLKALKLRVLKGIIFKGYIK